MRWLENLDLSIDDKSLIVTIADMNGVLRYVLNPKPENSSNELEAIRNFYLSKLEDYKALLYRRYKDAVDTLERTIQRLQLRPPAPIIDPDLALEHKVIYFNMEDKFGFYVPIEVTHKAILLDDKIYRIREDKIWSQRGRLTLWFDRNGTLIGKQIFQGKRTLRHAHCIGHSAEICLPYRAHVNLNEEVVSQVIRIRDELEEKLSVINPASLGDPEEELRELIHKLIDREYLEEGEAEEIWKVR